MMKPPPPSIPHHQKASHESFGDQFEDGMDAKPPVNFPPRKRSIPYGFDFDLDEVWAPLNPHLRSLKSTSSTPSPGSSASSSSENSISGLPRVPMQSASVFGSGGSSGDADTSRGPTARLSQRGRKSQHEDTEEFAVENEDIFMQISNLNIKDDIKEVSAINAAEESQKGNDPDAAVITNVGLPSARTLRGGASIVAQGRHGNVDRSQATCIGPDHHIIPPQSAMSNFSSYSTSSSRYSSGGTLSPSPSRRGTTQTGLTPGLFGENTRKTKLSPRKSLPK